MTVSLKPVKNYFVFQEERKMDRTTGIVFILLLFIIFILALIAINLLLKYLRRGKIVLPGILDPDDIVPPPTGNDKREAKIRLNQALLENDINPEGWDIDRIVVYPGGIPIENVEFMAVPTVVNCNQCEEGSVAGVLWDIKDAYNQNRTGTHGASGQNEFLCSGGLVYKVELGCETGKIRLFNEKFRISVEYEADFAELEKPTASTILFVEGSCYLCGCRGNRCGCLVCF
jgi:hypothetical protein